MLDSLAHDIAADFDKSKLMPLFHFFEDLLSPVIWYANSVYFIQIKHTYTGLHSTLLSWSYRLPWCLCSGSMFSVLASIWPYSELSSMVSLSHSVSQPHWDCWRDTQSDLLAYSALAQAWQGSLVLEYSWSQNHSSTVDMYSWSWYHLAFCTLWTVW